MNDTGNDIWKDLPLIQQGYDLVMRAETARVGREFTAREVPTVCAAFRALARLSVDLAERAYDENDPDNGGAAAG